MKNTIIVIGDGQMAKSICYFPGVLGYVSPKDLDTIYNVDGVRLGKVNPKKQQAVIGIADPKFKKESTEDWLTLGRKLTTLIHPQSTILGKPEIGPGTVVFPYAFIDHECVIGSSTYIGSHSAIHKAFVGDYVHITFGCQIIMSVVEEGVILGSNTTVLDGRTIGQYSIIGAGAVVHKDVKPRHKLIQKTNGIVNPLEEFNWTETHFKKKSLINN
jgi:acetyltransferase EpsM